MIKIDEIWMPRMKDRNECAPELIDMLLLIIELSHSEILALFSCAFNYE